MSRSRSWIWDFFGDKDDLYWLMYNNQWTDQTRVIYSVVGLECGKTDNWHLQGYVEWKHCKSKKQMYKYVQQNVDEPKQFYLTQRRGTPTEAAEYCKKGGKFVEVGTLPVGQGKRTDLDNVRTALEDGANLREQVQENRIQSYNFARIWLTWFEKKRNWKPKVYWLWGASGTGKTYRAKEMAKNMDTYWLNIPETGSKIWWDGYDKHECVIIDDYRPWGMSLRNLITIIGDSPCRVEIKGGFRQLLASTIIITTDKSPQQTYVQHEEELYQLERRITTTEEFEQKYDEQKRER